MKSNKKLMKQTRKAKRSYVPLSELNLADDFLFDVATMDLEICKDMLEIILGIKIKKVRWKENQKVVHNLQSNLPDCHMLL